jgi:hypothetical protein
MSQGSTIDPTALAHTQLVLIDPDGVLKTQVPQADAWPGSSMEEIGAELSRHGMRAEPAGPHAPQLPRISRYALAALIALPTVRIFVAVIGQNAVCGYIAVLADNDPRAIERDRRLIAVLVG